MFVSFFFFLFRRYDSRSTRKKGVCYTNVRRFLFFSFSLFFPFFFSFFSSSRGNNNHRIVSYTGTPKPFFILFYFFFFPTFIPSHTIAAHCQYTIYNAYAGTIFSISFPLQFTSEVHVAYRLFNNYLHARDIRMQIKIDSLKYFISHGLSLIHTLLSLSFVPSFHTHSLALSLSLSLSLSPLFLHLELLTIFFFL